MGDGTEFDDALLGLRGFRVTAVTESGEELLVGIETIRRAAGCPACGVIARTKDRLRVVIRDLPAFGRHVRLVWSKRRFSGSTRLTGVRALALSWPVGFPI
jgi:transposase